MGIYTTQTDRSNMMVLKQRLKTTEIRKTPSYTIYQTKTKDYVITAYEPGKLVSQGNGVEERAALIVPSVIQKIQSGIAAKKTQRQPKTIYPQASSDETGTGDYFDPVIVYATCVRYEDVGFLRNFRIQDFRAIDDTAIRRMAPKLTERLPRSLSILGNATHN